MLYGMGKKINKIKKNATTNFLKSGDFIWNDSTAKY
jgi:hypothetical protein